MTKLQAWTMTSLGTVALLVGVLLATGAITSAQSPTPTPSATEDTTDGGTAPTPDATDDTPEGDTEPGRSVRGCAGKIGVKLEAAEILGLTEEELRTQLEAGQTLAQIAQAQGMSVEDLKSALTASITADLQARLDAGEITQEQFDAKLMDLSDKLDAIINAEGGLRFRGPPPGFDGGTRFRFLPPEDVDVNTDA